MKRILSLALSLGLLAAVSACSEAAGPTAEAPVIAHEAGPGSAATDPLDTREILALNAEQRQHVLVEMRGLLLATQGVIEGLAEDDMAAVQTAASAVGMNALHTVESQANMKRLRMRETAPKEFMTLGMGVHKSFDEIAQMAADGVPAKDIQLKLVDTMNNCMACHSAYQIPNPNN